MRSRPMPVSTNALGRFDALTREELLELHEDEIPDLNEAVAVGIGRARRAARDLVAVIVEDLGAGAAGTRVAAASGGRRAALRHGLSQAVSPAVPIEITDRCRGRHPLG